MLRARTLRVTVRLCASLAIGSFVVAGPASAQTPSEIAAAKEWFAEGKKLEDQGDWAGALERFRRAAAVKKTPQILFHQGLCEKNTGALVEAIVTLSRAVEMARKANSQQVVGPATTELEDARARVPSIRIVAPQGDQPSRVLLDGSEISAAMLGEPMPVNPGKREVVAEFPSGRFTRTLDLVEKQSETVTLEAPAAPATPPPPPAPSAPATVAPSPALPPQAPPAADTGTAARGSSTVPWLLVGGGLVAAGGGVLFWVKRNGEINDLDSICPQRDACPTSRESDVNDAKSRGALYSVLGLGLMGVGVASMATGGYLLLGSSPSESHLALSPVAGKQTAGATIVGRF